MTRRRRPGQVPGTDDIRKRVEALRHKRFNYALDAGALVFIQQLEELALAACDRLDKLRAEVAVGYPGPKPEGT